MLYSNDIIKDTHEKIGIYPWNKWTSKEIQYTLSIESIWPSLASAWFLYRLRLVHSYGGGSAHYNSNREDIVAR